MNKTIITLAVVAAAAGVGYYFWKKANPTLATGTAVPNSGGGTGANASTASAFNGIASGIVSLFGKGPSASAGNLANGRGGATPVSTLAPSNAGFDYSYTDTSDYDPSNYEGTGGEF